MIDVLGGHIASVVTPLPEVIQHVRDGKLRMLATTTRQRTRFTPAGAAAMDKIGAEADLNTPEQFAALYRSTWERYRDVVKATGFTAED